MLLLSSQTELQQPPYIIVIYNKRFSAMNECLGVNE